jgi:hypothetical protein
VTLAVLIKKGGLSSVATATAATVATVEADTEGTVARVASVAVANPQKLLPETPEATPTVLLGPEEGSAIRGWLTHIDETDPRIIDEVLEKCKWNVGTLRYFLGRTQEIPKVMVTRFATCVICGDCIHFERIGHPHLGHCTQHEPEAIAGLWDTDRRVCSRWRSLEQNGGTSDVWPTSAKR